MVVFFFNLGKTIFEINFFVKYQKLLILVLCQIHDILILKPTSKNTQPSKKNPTDITCR